MILVGIHEQRVHVLTTNDDFELAVVSKLVCGFDFWDDLGQDGMFSVGLVAIFVMAEWSVVDVRHFGETEGSFLVQLRVFLHLILQPIIISFSHLYKSDLILVLVSVLKLKA